MRRITDRLTEARRDDRGFTLIELLIVIIILGVLAAIVVFSVRGITNNSEQAACKTEYRIVNTAIEAYVAENNGAEPANIAALVPGFLKEAPNEYVTKIGGTPPEALNAADEDAAAAC
ncbi:prepilin-type N-terminal cleavage/methylation domain-containing protein [Nocardioides sp. BYT-33-1]|jgi:general secretion pathway protein G|uniref:prepilin-type N-terminal cleavage/methylation domain-containing protein n=1 Tax=Nocardioides sp. BYT-33-1 TaxID=3416952 RepID=UPI003F533E58